MTHLLADLRAARGPGHTHGRNGRRHQCLCRRLGSGVAADNAIGPRFTKVFAMADCVDEPMARIAPPVRPPASAPAAVSPDPGKGRQPRRLATTRYGAFKDMLASRFCLPAAQVEAINAVPPDRLYELSAMVGVSHDELAREVAEFFGLGFLEYVDPAEIRGSELPLGFCRARSIVATGDDGGLTGFILSNPFDLMCTDEIARRTSVAPGASVWLASPDRIRTALGDPRPQSAPSEGVAPVDYNNLDTAKINVDVEGHPDAEIELLDARQAARIGQLAPVVRVVNMIFTEALVAGASDIHVEPHDSELLIRFRVDGQLVDAVKLPSHLKASVVSRLKIIGRLDIAERRRPQDGRARLRSDGRAVDLRISTLPAQFGEKVVIRLLHNSSSLTALDQLNLSRPNLEAFQRLLRDPQGLVIVTGPTGSGKTTTLYAALNFLKSPTKNVVTVENPIEFQMTGVTQVQIEPKAGMTFAAGLRSILRQDPNVILVGEVRDRETAHIAVEAAQTGHLLLTTLHTNDAATSITRLLDLEVEPYQLTSSLAGGLAQRLVRKVCANCAQPQRPAEDVARELGISERQQTEGRWRTGQGCPQCQGTGYKGRVAIHELLEVNDALRELISNRASDHLLRDAARRHGMVTLMEDGISKAAAGLTTLEEVLRVVPCFDAVKGETIETPDPVPEPVPTEPAAPAATAAPPIANRQPAGRSVLVIEDEPDTLAILTLMLRQNDCAVTGAADGIEALLALGRARFDLILSDINMPNMDGVALLEMKSQKGIDTPTIFLSADEGPERELQCLALGAFDYVRKPIKKDLLLLRLNRALGPRPA
jgi:type II secretory ATPase GspE/PulE/Tfp pilus assembly ATPase PilB-like protein/CheY-like chemotaxis protein